MGLIEFAMRWVQLPIAENAGGFARLQKCKDILKKIG